MDDLISRQVVLKDLKEYLVKPENAISVHPDDIHNYNSGLLTAIQVVTDTPPVQPEQKKGKWEEKTVFDEPIIDQWQSARCSICGLYHTTPYSYYFDHYKFCPCCGAEMEKNDVI